MSRFDSLVPKLREKFPIDQSDLDFAVYSVLNARAGEIDENLSKRLRQTVTTKSGESFSNFSSKLDDGRAVHFRLLAADTAKDNRKDNDEGYRFVLPAARTVPSTYEDGEALEGTVLLMAEENGALVIRRDWPPRDTRDAE